MEDNFYDSLILSIKPNYLKLILSGYKKYEFRNFRPKVLNNYFWIYESHPTKTLKYLMKVKQPIVYPEKVAGTSYGVNRFNSGQMKNKYAYEIEELYQLEDPLPLDFLRTNFNFTAPQSYTYLFNNTELQGFIKNNTYLIRLNLHK